MNRKEPEFNDRVEVIVSNTLGRKEPRITITPCRVTPKRVYTVGGSVFDRATGKQIMKLADRVWGTYRRRIDPKTIWTAP